MLLNWIHVRRHARSGRVDQDVDDREVAQVVGGEQVVDIVAADLDSAAW